MTGRKCVCRDCGGAFTAPGTRGVVPSRCPDCRAEWRRKFDRERSHYQTKAGRMEHFEAQKAAGMVWRGKVRRGRPPASGYNFGRREWSE